MLWTLAAVALVAGIAMTWIGDSTSRGRLEFAGLALVAVTVILVGKFGT